MWDRLLTDCHVATMVAQPGNPLGLFPNAAIGIADGRIVRVGKRVELAGFRAKEVTPCGGAWVTPGLVDCHTHLVFGGTRANEHAMRRAGATYEEIAQAGGGIASTVAATKAASADELRESARRRLHALMAGGVTTVEIKSGYGLDTASEIRLLNAARAIGRDEPVRIVTTLLAAHALPSDAKEGPARDVYVKMIVDDMIPSVAKAGLATSVDAFCETIAFTPAEVERVFTAARANGLPVRLHADQLSNQNGAALAASYKALSADHLEHLDALGARAMASAGTVAVLLPGAYYKRKSRRSICCATRAWPSPSPATATPALRLCSIRSW
jgi:imidazolonepropionase